MRPELIYGSQPSVDTANALDGRAFVRSLCKVRLVADSYAKSSNER